MAAPMQELLLIDADDNKEYKVVVSHEDAEKARRDMTFATLLLEEAKRNVVQPTLSNLHCNVSLTTNEPSTSTNSNSRNGNLENIEGTHIWSKDETLLLVNTYSEYKEEFHNGKCTVKQNWKKIAKIMQDKGYNVTGLKCSTKFQALKRTYKGIVDHNNKSGNNPKKWEYFKNMQELFADKPWVQPLAVAGSHVNEIEEEKKDDPPEKYIKRKKLNTIVEEYIISNQEERKKRRELREEQHNEKMGVFKRIENIMETLLKRND